jgi:hypothetical protein
MQKFDPSTVAKRTLLAPMKKYSRKEYDRLRQSATKTPSSIGIQQIATLIFKKLEPYFKRFLSQDEYKVDAIFEKLNADQLGDDTVEPKFDVRNIKSMTNYVNDVNNSEVITAIKENIKRYYDAMGNGQVKNIDQIYTSAVVHNIIDYLCSPSIDFSNQQYTDEELQNYTKDTCGEEMPETSGQEEVQMKRFGPMAPSSVFGPRPEPVGTPIFRAYNPKEGRAIKAEMPAALEELKAKFLETYDRISEENLMKEYDRLKGLQTVYGETTAVQQQLAGIENMLREERMKTATARATMMEPLEQKRNEKEAADAMLGLMGPGEFTGGKKKTTSRKSKKSSRKSKKSGKSKPKRKSSTKKTRK